MINRLFKATLGAFAIAGMIGLPSVAMAESDHQVTINLYNLTDVHGHIEKVEKHGKVKEAGLEAVGCYLNKHSENSAFTLLGDNIGASPFTSGILYDNPTIKALNLLQPVASTIGNHELDLGQDVFKARLNGTKANINGEEVQMERVGFPYMAANVTGLEGLQQYKIKEIAGVKVAYIGAIAQDVPYKLDPHITDGLTFGDPIAAVNKLAKQLKDSKQADVVIAMLDDDVKKNINKFSDDVDGLMGGDTHVPYYFSKGDTVPGLNEPAKITGTASGSYTDNLSNLQITFDTDTKKIVSSKAIQIPASELVKCGPDPAVAAVVSDAKTKSQEAGEKVIASGITQPFYRGVYADEEGAKIVAGSNRGTESTLGDLIADSIKATVKTQGSNPKPIDIGIINAGGIRNDLLPSDSGDLTYADTYNVMPFSNEMGYITLTGKEFKQTLEEQWKVGLSSQNSRPMLKLGVSSNVHYIYDWTKPAGQRVTSITIDGKPMDMSKNYTVGSVTFLLAGGDTFNTIGAVNNTPGRAFVNTGNLDRDEFNKYLASNSGIKPEQTKRSVGISADLNKTYKPGDKADISMRGLSFSERGKFAKAVPFSTKVTAYIAGVPFEAAVDNTLFDPNGSYSDTADTSKAFATTDGVGKARITVSADKVCQKVSGKQTLPIEVKTDTGTVVARNAGLTMKVDCPAAAQPAKAAPAKNKGKLAHTGTNTNYLFLYAMMLLVAGGVATGVRYATR